MSNLACALRPAALLLTALSAVGVAGCVLDTFDPGGSRGPSNCSSDADCGEQEQCEPVDGRCVALTSVFERVLLQIIPPGSEPGFGGVHLFQAYESLAQPGELEVVARRPLRVTGFVQASEQSPCTAGSTTHEATVTFRPREALLGIEAPRYTTRTESVIIGQRDQLHCFEGVGNAPSAQRIEHCLRAIDLPPGRYDVYIEPTGLEPSTCQPVIPQIIRDLDLRAEEGATVVRLVQTPTPRLALTIPWHPSLLDWTLDVVHDVSAEVISSRVVLSREIVSAGQGRFEGMEVARAELNVSQVSGTDFSEPGRELVRLIPPAALLAPRYFFSRSALEGTPGEAVLPALPALGTTVEVHAWVVAARATDQAVAARVRFDAVELTGVARGLFASFGASASTNQDGEVVASLLQGQYRVRTIPSEDAPLSALQSALTVWPPDPNTGEATQAGQVIQLPPAARLDGQLRISENAGGAVAVHATVARFLPECTSAAGATAGLNCRRQGSPVLSSALGADLFIPRTRNQWLTNTPDFSLDMDCGACEPEQGTLYDLSLRPEPGTGLGWEVYPSVMVSQGLSMGEIALRAGVVHRGVLQFVTAGQESGVFPGALIRAYALQDDTGQVGPFEEQLEPCIAIRSRAAFMGQRCAANVVLIHETRVDENGQFRLQLPVSARSPDADISN